MAARVPHSSFHQEKARGEKGLCLSQVNSVVESMFACRAAVSLSMSSVERSGGRGWDGKWRFQAASLSGEIA